MRPTTPPHMAARGPARRQASVAVLDADALTEVQQRLLARAWLHDVPSVYEQGVRDVVAALQAAPRAASTDPGIDRARAS